MMARPCRDVTDEQINWWILSGYKPAQALKAMDAAVPVHPTWADVRAVIEALPHEAQ